MRTSQDALISTRVTLAVAVAVAYLAWIVMTPFNRFPFLTDIHFERLLMGFGWLVAIVSVKRQHPVFDRFSAGLILFLVALTISHILGPYSDREAAQVWSDEYWKSIVYFLLLVFLVSERSEVHDLIVWSGIVVAAYIGYSLLDFAKGGSYVYQQGIPRATGVWSGGGLGAPNAFGFLGLFLIPFGIYIWYLARSRKHRTIGLAIIGLAAVAILLSGTRAALVCALLVLFIAFRRRFMKLSYILIALLFLSIVWFNLPDDVRMRYVSILPTVDTSEVANATAESSAQSRLEGLKDGWRLFQQRPVLGFGPGSSQYARVYVSDFIQFNPEEPRYLQLHNLYGQVLAESGVIGSLLFILLIWWTWRTATYTQQGTPETGDFGGMKIAATGQFLKLQIIGVFAYGMFAHNLYSHFWLYIFALGSMASRLCLPRTALYSKSGT